VLTLAGYHAKSKDGQMSQSTTMNTDYQRTDGVETIELSRHPSTVSIILMMAGVLLVVQTIIVLATTAVDLTLMVLLVIAAASAGWLALIALDSVMPITVRMDKDGIAISKLIGETTLLWADVAAAKLVQSAGTLSDDPSAAASGRLAVGLFLKSRKTPRAHEFDADIVVFGAAESHAHELLKLVEHITEFKATIGAGQPDRGRRIRKAAPIAPPTAFRRPRSAA
jgi:hypothetical protein